MAKKKTDEAMIDVCGGEKIPDLLPPPKKTPTKKKAPTKGKK